MRRCAKTDHGMAGQSRLCVRPSGLHSSLYFWYRGELADFQDRRLRTRRAVAVDDKARIVLLHQGGVECVRDHAAERGDADFPSDVRIELMAAGLNAVGAMGGGTKENFMEMAKKAAQENVVSDEDDE